MALVFVSAFLIVISSLIGYYLGPGISRDVCGGIALVFLVIILYRVFKGGRDGKGLRVGNEAEGPPGP